jgi:site-specific DNA recombinase
LFVSDHVCGSQSHKRSSYPGQHEAIIEREIWQKAAAQLGQRSLRSRGHASGSTASLLVGKLFDEQGEGLTPSHAKKGDRRYRLCLAVSDEG